MVPAMFKEKQCWLNPQLVTKKCDIQGEGTSQEQEPRKLARGGKASMCIWKSYKEHAKTLVRST